MPKPASKRFQLASRRVKPGDTGEVVAQVQRYLRRYGYLRGGAERARLDDATQDALKRFQERAAIPPTGAIDDTTAEALEKPRCGTPDLPAARGPLGEFVLRGCSYQAQFRTLTYAFVVVCHNYGIYDRGSQSSGLRGKVPERSLFGLWVYSVFT